MGEANSDSESIVTITEDELTLLIISSIHTLKGNKTKCGRLELYNIVKESPEFEISSEVFTETLNSLIESESVIVNTFRNRKCISLLKKIFRKLKLKIKISRSSFINLKMTF